MRPTLTLSILMMGLLAVSFTGCGGGGSSTTGSSSAGSSTAVIQGQVASAQTSRGPESVIVVALRTTLGIGLAEAVMGTPIEGASVELFVGVIDPGETPIATTQTDASGNFHFTGLAPGTYTIRVTTTVPSSVNIATVTVGAGDNAIVGVTASSGTPPAVTVTTSPFDIDNDAQFGHAMNIDRASASCDLNQVLALRDARHGWGDIAHECNVSPGVIGLGHPDQGDLDSARAAHGGGKGKGKKT